MKKLLCLLCITALLAMISFAAFADELKPGDSFAATFSVTANPNDAVAATVQLNYDHEVIEFVSSKDIQNDKAGLMNLSGIAVGTSISGTFQVKIGAADGTYPMTVSLVEAQDIDETIVSGLTLTAFSVVVKGDEPTPQDCTHSTTKENVIKKPSCTEAGEKEIVCAKCGEKIRTEEISALGHDDGEWKEVKKPTCTEKGSKELHCTRCAELLKTEAIEPLGHDDGAWKEVKKPTCTKEGSKELRCTRCNELLKTEAIKPLGHDGGAWKEVKKPTCTEKGSKELHCTRCDALLKTEAIEPLGHDYQWKTVKAATTTAEGLEQNVCARCGDVKEERTIPMIVEQWINNQIICSEGISFRDVKPGLTSNWFMFTPIDLSQNGTQEVKLIIGYSRYAGTATVKVQDGKVTVNYKLNPYVKGSDMAFTFLLDLTSTESIDMKTLKAYAFNQEISIADDLNGDTSVLLYVFGHGDYDFAQDMMDWFLPNAASYRNTVNQLKELMD